MLGIKLLLLALCLSIFAAFTSIASDIDYATARLERRLAAIRVNEEVTIDGLLNEPAWQKASVATNFVQSEPKEGEPATDKTEVRVMYDQDNLYIGAMIYDSEPSKLIINELKKDYDSTQSDAFGIVIDTFHDRRNGYQFITNPGGAKFDTQFTNESDVNRDWDGVWFVKTRIVEVGWIAEVAIPFKTMRFPSDSRQTWGINFLRRTRRHNEDTYWSPIPRMYRIFRISLAGTLEGLEGIRPASNIRIKPYVVSSLSQTNGPTGIRDHGKVEGGIDFKYGIGPALSLDASVNTDFSQVEADEQQVNLTRFSLFFPEKREFFLENIGIFAFGSLPNVASGSSIRQIGASDDLFFFSRRIGISDDGREIPLLGGARLSGRMGSWSLGFLNVQTREASPTPATNFTVARVRKNILATSQIGAIFINKKESATGRFNRGYGVDANLRFGGSSYFNMFYANTDSSGIRSQDDAFRGSFAYVSQTWDVRSNYSDISANFRPEVGFYPRIGIKRWSSFAAVKVRPRWLPGWLRELSTVAEPGLYWTQSNRQETKDISTRQIVSFQDGSVFEVGREGNFERLFVPFRIQQGAQIGPGDYWFDNYYAVFNASRAKKIGPTLRFEKGDFYSGEKTTYAIGGTLRPNFHLATTMNYTRNKIILPHTRFTTDLITTRFDYSFSTTMFLNALIQYNTDARQWSSNIRFNIIHRPLSDLFLVYNERRRTSSRDLIDRAIIAKFTYMFGY